MKPSSTSARGLDLVRVISDKPAAYGKSSAMSACGILPSASFPATGIAIGAAMAGSRTIIDEVFLDFSLEAMSQIVQQAANICYSSNGKIEAPVVVRAAMGAIRSAGAHHSPLFLQLVRKYTGP